ncbi:class I SAM-dependent methyltransferase [Sinomonas albida]|uniref:class I SAM-dependent methyltransferase n=1 Tax=Sinomonas albida TaxID=369942 RepID=UPI00301B47EA
MHASTELARVYDGVAAEYFGRAASDYQNDVPIVDRVWQASQVRLQQTRDLDVSAVRVLDVGCGSGVNLAMFEALGADATGIDVSPNMVRAATITSPNSMVILGDIRTQHLPDLDYHIVFAKAFVHLFPLKGFDPLMRRMKSLTRAGGILYIATTSHQVSSEGYFEKADYRGSPVRFRRYWNESDLRTKVSDCGFRVLDSWNNTDPRNGKLWTNLILTDESR